MVVQDFNVEVDVEADLGIVDEIKIVAGERSN